MNRKEIIQFLEKEETYNQILDIINRECQNNGTHIDAYPQDYFIAGGSVANTIHYILNKTEKPIINDVDLFYFRHQTEPSWGYLHDVNSFLSHTINPVTNVDSYGRVWRGSQGEEIKMVNSERFGLINKVTIDVHLWQNKFNPTIYYTELLSGFDLNCTPVGLDRVNCKIIYTDKFVDFLLTNRIEVIGINHPLQTAVRLLKKSKELKTDNSNFENEMSLLQHSFLLHDQKAIGPEWIEKSKEYKDFIANYFRPHPYQEAPQDLFYYTSKDFILKPYVTQFNFYGGTSALIGFWDLFVRLKDINKLNKIMTFYTQHRGLKIESEKYTWSLEVKSIRNNYINNNYIDFIICLNTSPNYFNCDFEVSDLVSVDNFLKFMRNGYMDPQPFIVSNIKEQLKFITFFTDNFIDKHGFFKMQILNRVVNSSTYCVEDKVGISSLNVDDKISVFNKLLNNLWIKPKNSRIIRHIFRPKLTFNLNDDEF